MSSGDQTRSPTIGALPWKVMPRIDLRQQPVSRRALVQRINRRLRYDGQILRKARRWNSDTGDNYILDTNTNFVVRGHVDLEQTARQLGVLSIAEEVAA